MYDRIDFNAIEDEELRHLVTARICQPMSKWVMVDYFCHYFKYAEAHAVEDSGLENKGARYENIDKI